MILSITDGIEVAEHTEPMERAEFLREFRATQTVNAAYDEYVTGNSDSPMPAFLRRQAE
jgi:hypothetical protein